MLVEQLVQDGAIEPVVTAFVYNPDATRNRDMSCYTPTHSFLADELLPLLRERFRAARSPARTILDRFTSATIAALADADRPPPGRGQSGLPRCSCRAFPPSPSPVHASLDAGTFFGGSRTTRRSSAA